MATCVTGGCGFIGSHFVEFLLKTTNDKIIVIDRIDETSTIKRLTSIPNWENYKERIIFKQFDLKNHIPFLSPEFECLKDVNTIYHFAASSHVDRSIQNPSLFIMDNVMGTVNLLNWMRNSNAKLIYISSDEVFGEAKPFYAYKEYDASNPSNPYSSSKAAAENIVKGYTYTYNLNAKIIRLTNILGIKQHPEKFLVLLIKSILDNKEVFIHTDDSGKDESTRYYLDIRDLCPGIILIDKTHIPSLSKNANQGIYHLSGYTELMNSSIARSVAKIMNRDIKLKYISQVISRPNHDLHYRIDDTSTRELLHWNTYYTIEETLNYCVKWYLNNPEWLNVQYYKS